MKTERTTKYSSAVASYMKQVGHASNAQILDYLHESYPDVSATTVHRITARMLERGELVAAPATRGNAVRFDANKQPHDHFQCTNCDRLRDVDLLGDVLDSLENMVGDCDINGRINVQGACSNCMKKEDKST